MKTRDKYRWSAYAVTKRMLDVVFSSILILFLALPMLIIWCAVRIDSEGDGIFRQSRVGRDGRLFVCYKFRSMYISAPPNCPSSKFSTSKEYITPVGGFLRRSSLDELPQLFNVLRGNMSIVGPRPLIIEEREVHDSRRENGVYSLRPGITGLSQISGRDSLSDEEKVMLDTRYLASFGLVQDLKIIGATVGRVITGDGISKK